MSDNEIHAKLDQRPDIVNTVPVSTEDALADVGKLKGKVVLVTGAASGFGRGYALRAAAAGAKLAISDLKQEGVDAVVKQIQAGGGTAFGCVCNVVEWDQQLDFFERTIAEYGVIDVVAVNAGVAEIGIMIDDRWKDDKGRPKKPVMTTAEVNITGMTYTVRLAFFYLRKNPASTGKAIFILGSMASYLAIPLGPLYSMSKHAMMGLFRSLEQDAKASYISLSLICPWFCTTTGILRPDVVFSLSGLPMTDETKVVDAMLLASVTESCGDAFAVDAEGILRVPGPAMYYDYTQTNYYIQFAKRAHFVINLRNVIRDAVHVLIKPATQQKIKAVGLGVGVAAVAGAVAWFR